MVIFQILDCYSQDLKIEEKNEFVIHLFGTTNDGKPIRLNIQNFKPYFYVELPDVLKGTYDSIVNTIREKLQNDNLFNGITKERVTKEKLYGYTNNMQFPFVKLSVDSMNDLYTLKKVFLNEKNNSKFKIKNQILKVYEANLDPMLRFFHLRNISPCGWVSIDEDYSESIDIDWQDISPYTNPSIAPFKYAFWDIECYSESGAFPLANKDPVIQIGVVFTTNNNMGEKHIFVLDGSDELEDGIVHNCLTEREMILKFLKVVHIFNPDIFVGYNIFGFDMRYLYERMEVLKITMNPMFQKLSRVEDIYDKEVSLQKKILSSSALGDNTLYIWSTIGRLHIDLYYYIKRIENLGSYKLDDVCRHYMSGKLDSIDTSDKDKWFIKTKSTSDAEVGKYIVLLDEIGDTIVEKTKILEVIPKKGIMIEASYESSEELETIVSWATVKDDVSPAEIFRLHREGGTNGRAIVAKYCIQDCVLVYNLFNKLDVFNNAMAMANTCSVPINYIFTRGQGIKCESLIFKECGQRNQLIEVLESPKQKEDEDFSEETYEGAIVLVPEPNFYAESPIGVADFASLYPSTIISENISYDTLLWSKDYTNDYNFICYSFGSEHSEKYLTSKEKFTDIEFDIWVPDPNDKRKNPEKIKTGIRVCRYVQQPDDKKGSLPDILTKLLLARKTKRKEAEKESDPFKKALLDAEQTAYKLTANSLYGQLGSGTFKVRLQHLAASTTAYGRKQILFAKDAIEKFYGKTANDSRCEASIVYGDTDSLFVNFKVRNPETGELLKGKEAIEATMALTEEAGKFVTRCLKKPHDFEYDKVFYPFIIFSKKRYVGNKYEDSSDYYKQTSMGIATKRRDYAAIVKNVYGGAIKILLNEKDPVKAFTFVQKTCNDLVDGKISNHQLTLTKSLRSEYKASTPPAHKMLAQRISLRDPGNAPNSGDRLQFMYVLPNVGQLASKLQGDRIETPSYIKEHNLKIDFRYYIEHQIYNPITQLFGLFVDKMPGYVTPLHDMGIEEKEAYAGELLFKYIYEKCDKQNVRNFAEKFGFSLVKNNSVKQTQEQAVPQPSVQTKKQMTINFPALNRELIRQYDEIKKKEKAQENEIIAATTAATTTTTATGGKKRKIKSVTIIA